jgi:hypothetical protein
METPKRKSAIVLILCCAAFSPLVAKSQSQSADQPPAAASTTQKTFGTPQLAAEALIQATTNYDLPALMAILGPDGKDLVSSADPVQDKNRAEVFAGKAREKYAVIVDPKNKSRATISVGNDDWPFPVPIIKQGNSWRFDSKQGRNELLYRRIGTNELDAIQVCRGFVEAQKEYASQVHDDSGINQYAQRIISTPGKQDGLYWQNPDGTAGGPVSEAVARAIDEGYSADPGSGYHGYYFKVLRGQGPSAPMGQLDYVIEGVMIGGFALVAVPAQYRVTGVKTFIVSYEGIVYEKDLGPQSLELVKNMDRFNPDKTWRPTDDQWPDNVSAAD